MYCFLDSKFCRTILKIIHKSITKEIKIYGYHGYNRRRRNCNCNGDDGIITFIALMLMLIFALPFVGIYLLYLGKTETQKIIGGIICVVMFLGWIASMF